MARSDMGPAVILVILLALSALGVVIHYLVLPALRRRWPQELRGDWWPQFEADFRAYADRTSAWARRRNRDRRPPR